MARMFKVIFVTVLIVTVVFAFIAEMTWPQKFFNFLDLAAYIRIASIIGLLIAAFMAWGYKRGIEASQKYLRAQHVLAEAELAAERKQCVIAQLEESLKAQFAEKETLLQEDVKKIRADYNEQLTSLKEQNLRLKETVSKLMQALKKR